MTKKQLGIFLTVVVLLLAALIVGIVLTDGLYEKNVNIQESMQDAVLHEGDKVWFFGMQVNPGLISAYLVTAVILIFAAIVRIAVIPRFKIIPGKFQLVLEEAVGMFDGMAKNNSPHRNKFLGAYIFAAAAYIFVGTLFELVGFPWQSVAEKSVTLPAPLSDINGAIALGCLSYLVILAGGITLAFITPKYSASSMIYILTKTTSVTSLADIQMGTQLTADFEVLATSRPVVESVIEKLSLDLTYEELVDMITVSNTADTRILQITVEHPQPEMAASIANAMADATADSVAEIMSTDRPSIVEDAVVPTSQSSPSLVKNAALGGFGLAFLVAAAIVILHLTDDTVKNEDDVKKYLGLNTLASLPVSKNQKSSESHAKKSVIKSDAVKEHERKHGEKK